MDVVLGVISWIVLSTRGVERQNSAEMARGCRCYLVRPLCAQRFVGFNQRNEQHAFNFQKSKRVGHRTPAPKNQSLVPHTESGIRWKIQHRFEQKILVIVI